MAKLLSTIIDGFLSSKTFVSGALGSGWRIWKRLGRWMFEIDDLVVRNTMTVFELLISKIRAVKGALGITQASGKIKSMREDEDYYYVQIEDEMSFMAHDIIRCMEFSGNQKNYWVIVSDVENNELVIPKTEFTGSSLPAVGDEIVQFGNTINKSRQSAIYLHADENGEPAIDVLFGIKSKTFEGCTKVRIGGDIPGEAGYKGFFCENGLIKSVNESGETMYMLRPDGSGFVAKEAIKWATDGSGNIGGGAITWRYDENTGKYVVEMGSNVVLKWNNLDAEVQKNLKGENGTSITWKGDLSSHPSNPKDGWAYKNTATGKSYIYQDNGWYVMTVDGINGDDGLSIVWKGDLATPPVNPLKNWAYRDTDDGKVYIYDGVAWALMVVDGSDGANGHGVFLTYHDSETEPSRPTGDGTTGGWHTNSTSSVIWMSQKVAGNASSGTWGNPINFKGRPGKDANLLPWVEDWNNNTLIDNVKILTPKIFAGTLENDVMSGVALGIFMLAGKMVNGLTGYNKGREIFHLGNDYNKISGWDVSEDSFSCLDKCKLKSDGTGYLASGNLKWDAAGNILMNGRIGNPYEVVTAPSGTYVYRDISYADVALEYTNSNIQAKKLVITGNVYNNMVLTVVVRSSEAPEFNPATGLPIGFAVTIRTGQNGNEFASITCYKGYSAWGRFAWNQYLNTWIELARDNK